MRAQSKELFGYGTYVLCVLMCIVCLRSRADEASACLGDLGLDKGYGVGFRTWHLGECEASRGLGSASSLERQIETLGRRP